MVTRRPQITAFGRIFGRSQSDTIILTALTPPSACFYGETGPRNGEIKDHRSKRHGDGARIRGMG